MSHRLLIPLLVAGMAVGCGEASSPRGSEPVMGSSTTSGSTTIPGELPIGERPSIAVEPYWFGRQVGEAEALIATQTRSHGPFRRYDVYYELPTANGNSSALPGQAPPPGEIHVISVSLRGPVARRMVESYMTGAHSPVVLASGETATFFANPGPSDSGFAIATNTTLVQVIGPAVTPLVAEEKQSLAARLLPL